MIKNDKFIKRDFSLLGRWWWTVDHYLLFSVLLLTLIGVLLSFSASPCVAFRIGFNRFFFVKRHLIIVPLSLGLVFFVSLLSAKNIRRLALLMMLLGIMALIAVFFIGHEVKGANRWIIILGQSIQPSEFVKPALIVLVASLLSEKQNDTKFPGITLSGLFVGLVVSLVLFQPDVGMTLIILASFFVQLFIAGLPMLFVIVSVILGCLGIVGAYFFIPHAQQRINSFLYPELGDRDQMYQIKQSIEAFHHGRWFGRGPGEGVVKRLVPDAHADFVFSVAGEEYGIFLCLLITFLFAFVVFRSFSKISKEGNLFSVFCVAGLAVQLGLQAFVNMATTLHLIPTKGMTMPFISYGGSSMLAVGITMGIILSLTRKRHGQLVDI